MAAFQNIIDLRFGVSDLVGNRAISDVFPRLVEMAENDFNSRFRTRQQLMDATLFFEDGVSPLPPDFLELYEVKGRWANSACQVGSFDITIPCAGGDVDVQYYAKLPTITCSPTATNWLLARHPDVYLYGTALQAAKHLRDAELAVQLSSLYSEAVNLLRVDDERARWGAATVRVQGVTP